MAFSPATWTDGVTQFDAAQGTRIDNGIIGAVAPTVVTQIGKISALLHSDNGTTNIGPTTGTEYGIGVSLSAQTWDQVGMTINAAVAGSSVRIGLRALATDGTVGAPVIDAAVSGAATGIQMTSFTAVAILSGLYVVTWTRLNDAGNALLVHRCTVTTARGVFSVSGSSTGPATGHDPAIDTFNTGITTTLPSTVVRADRTTSLGGGLLPQILFRRSA